MGQTVDIKNEEESIPLKEDLEALQDTINRIDDRIRFLCRVDSFGQGIEDKQFYEYFIHEKSEFENFLRKLKSLNDNVISQNSMSIKTIADAFKE